MSNPSAAYLKELALVDAARESARVFVMWHGRYFDVRGDHAVSSHELWRRDGAAHGLTELHPLRYRVASKEEGLFRLWLRSFEAEAARLAA